MKRVALFAAALVLAATPTTIQTQHRPTTLAVPTGSTWTRVTTPGAARVVELTVPAERMPQVWQAAPLIDVPGREHRFRP